MDQSMFFGVEVSWLRGGREMFRYPTEVQARKAEIYLGREHPDVKFAVYAGRRSRGAPAPLSSWRKTG